MPLNISARRDLALSREQAQNTKGYTHPGGWRARSSQENTGFSKIAPGTGVQGQTQGVPLGVIVTEPALAPNARDMSCRSTEGGTVRISTGNLELSSPDSPSKDSAWAGPP